MDPAQPSNFNKLLTLQEAALMLAVSVDTLLSWNEHNILKPTITPAGQIGYTKAQIDQFLTIKNQISQPSPVAASGAMPYSTQSVEGFIRAKTNAELHLEEKRHVLNIVQDNFGFKSDATSTKINNFRTIYSSKFIVPLMVTFTIFAVAILIGQGQILSLLNQYQNQSNNQTKVLGAQTSKLQLNQTVNLSNNNNNDSSVFRQNNFLLAKKLEKNTTATGTAIASVTGSKNLPKGQVGVVVPLSEVSNFSKNIDNSSAIDSNGNIRGDANKTNTIATILGTAWGLNNNPTPSNTDPKNQLILLSMMTLIGALYLIKKPRRVAVASVNRTGIEAQKVIEVDQKTDGTVVLLFQGQEYKVSKPELYSDSDRFIERLMELVQPGVKEMEYDLLMDEKNSLTAPLSRLVTRLGFVGLKRDLFFPRTSKNRVLFRKYITREDLTSMNLTPQQIIKELLLQTSQTLN